MKVKNQKLLISNVKVDGNDETGQRKATRKNSFLTKLGVAGEMSITEEESVMEQLIKVVSDNPLMKKLGGEAHLQKQQAQGQTQQSNDNINRMSLTRRRSRKNSMCKKKTTHQTNNNNNGFMNTLLRSFVSEAENTEAVEVTSNKKKPTKQKKGKLKKSKSIHEGLKGLKSEASATANKVRKEEIIMKRASHLSRIAKVHNDNSSKNNNLSSEKTSTINVEHVIPHLVKNRNLWKDFQTEVLDCNNTENVDEAKISFLLHQFVHRRYDEIMHNNTNNDNNANPTNSKRHSMLPQTEPSMLLSGTANAFRKRNSIAGIITSITTTSDLAQECYVLPRQSATTVAVNNTTNTTTATNAQSSIHSNPLQPGLATLAASANNSFGADVL